MLTQESEASPDLISKGRALPVVFRLPVPSQEALRKAHSLSGLLKEKTWS